MTDITLAFMPYGPVERPSIAIGLIAAALRRAGFDTQVDYANLEFAAEIGVNLYSDLSLSHPQVQIAEWTFAGALFPDFHPDHAAYQKRIDRTSHGQWLAADPQRSGALWDLLWDTRRKAEPFIDRIARRILESRPRIVGCSSAFQQNCASLALLKRIRELAPETITIIGGGNSEGEMGVAILREFPWIDVAVSGEADELVVDLCTALMTRGRDLAPGDIRPGILSGRAVRGDANRRAAGRAMLEMATPEIAGTRATVRNLDVTATPDYDDYFATLRSSTLVRNIDPGLPIETSRGCWWGEKHHCTFCGLNGTGMVYRSKSPARILEEFASLSSRYGIRRFQVVDNILDVSHIKSVLPALAGEADPYVIFYEVKANLRRDQMQQLADAGVTWIQPGLESLHDEVLKLMDKGNTALMNVQVLKWARELGMRVAWNMLYGVPGEEDAWYAEMARWMPLLEHLQPPGGLGQIRYDRFSPHHNRPADFGITLAPFWGYRYVYPMPDDRLMKLAYFFEDAGGADALPIARRKDGRPGLDALTATTHAWDRRWTAAKNDVRAEARLSFEEHDGQDGITITDTRTCAVAPLWVARGLSADILRLCDRAMPQRAVVDAIQAERSGITEAAIGAAVEDLVDRRLLLKLDGRVLSLGVSYNHPPLPSTNHCPAGCVYVDRRGNAARSAA